MPANRDVAIIVGSLRKESVNRKVAKAIADLAPAHLSFRFVEIGDLALYNEDVEKAGAPESWVSFRAAVKSADAILFATPEYNRSVPGVLKNAIDVGSRPYGQSVWSKKPAAIVSVSLGVLGGYGANHHLRQSAVFLDMPMLQQPELYIGQGQNLFDENGALKEESTKKLFQNFANVFAEWIEKTAAI